MPNDTDLSNICRDEGIKDIWLVGYLEKGASRRKFHPMLWWIYAEFHTAYIRLEAVNEWHMKFELAQTIGVDFSVDPDDEFATVRIGDLFLPTVPKQTRKVTRFDVLLDEDSSLEGGIVKSGGFVFENGETVFFDPSNTFGFRIGTEIQVREWTSSRHHPLSSYRSVSIVSQKGEK